MTEPEKARECAERLLNVVVDDGRSAKLIVADETALTSAYNLIHDLAARLDPGEDVAGLVERCARYRPDLMAGGTDCASCGWPREQHSPYPAQDVAGLVEELVPSLASLPLDNERTIVKQSLLTRTADALTTLSARVREAEALVADCAPWLKPGETPAKRIEREFNDHGAALLSEAAALKRAEKAEARAERLREALETLHALVWGECPALLREDSGGDARTDEMVRAALTGEGA